MPAALYVNGPSTGIGVAIVNTAAALVKSILEVGSRIVVSTSTALSLTLTQHAEKEVFWEPNSSGAATATLPAATGSGVKYKLTNGIAQTQGSLVVAALGTDVIKGVARMFDSSAAADAMFFATSATSDKMSMSRTTTGGVGYDTIVFQDKAAGVWSVDAALYGSGTMATPFSET